MKQEAKELCLTIAKDPDFFDGFENLGSPYHEICSVQKNFEEKQLPEPWNGNIEKARIMFISSNPSISEKEIYPTDNSAEWPDDRIADFFENRFTNGCRRNDGTPFSVNFWTGLIKHTNWISEICLGNSIPKICPEGRNYKDHYYKLNDVIVSTELVHCKSKNEIGVNACLNDQFKYMKEIVSLFNGEIIVLFGNYARNKKDEIKQFVQGRNIRVLALPAPAAHGFSDDDRREEIRRQWLAISSRQCN